MIDPPQFEDPWSVKIDNTKPSVARLYDALLGGKDNYEADRQLMAKVLEVAPEAVVAAMDLKEFQARAVRFLAHQGHIDQFLVCGPGLPTTENIHQIVQRVNRDARVVYVDIDPVVLAHGRALMEDNEQTHLVDANIFRPCRVMHNPIVRRMLDFDRPMALVHAGTLHHYLGDRPVPELMREYIDALPSGSFLVLAHFCDPKTPEATPVARGLQEVMQSSIGSGTFRTRAEIEAMFPSLEMIEPGVIECALWWSDGPPPKVLAPVRLTMIGGLGRKP